MTSSEATGDDTDAAGAQDAEETGPINYSPLLRRSIGPGNEEARQLVRFLDDDDDSGLPPVDPSLTPLQWILKDSAIYASRRFLARDLGRLMVARGYPLMRMTYFITTLHPQATGTSIIWYRDVDAPRQMRVMRGMQQTPAYKQSPMPLIFEGAQGIRRRLDMTGEQNDFPILNDLREEGATDYVAMPLVFSDGNINFTTWTADRPGGFSTEELREIWEFMPALSLRMEVLERRDLTRQLLTTYLGRNTGERILAGEIVRGVAEGIRAAVWYTDIRDFTTLSDQLSRDEIIDLLDDYFERAVQAVEERGGEVLKFLGDGMLAIFPADPSRGQAEGDMDACRLALTAARDTVTLMRTLNDMRRRQGKSVIDFGIALHLGEVGYGNIGGAERLDFTVIGPAVNLANRIEGLTRTLGVRVLASREFSDAAGEPLTALGGHPVKGLTRPIDVFTPPDLS
ncbi:adenylate/guanylate cyclase domain-containing protein [Thalassobaculum litoreum]|uniref:Adenylate cyclase n=1 Tax=Thalassobaculum litoreum DSM 18839 TaxID=1123362 RepID=A0A8G2BK47_9PROT|nr:adenylate/guanylate cyclase domain-containing protein [Thalassobaculum litoreum]SDF74806.1 adenylate cyclase [Thalassobaculum litoreum DSM 18839]